MSVLFLSECYTETLLYSTLLYDQSHLYTHRHGVNEVLKSLKFQDLPFETLIGCIDNDKHLTFAYMNEFTVQQAEYGVAVLKHQQDESKILIQLSPAAETWLLETAKAANINPADFKLPATPDKLKVFSTINSKQNRAILKSFIKAIFTSGNERSNYLRGIVESYYEKPDWLK
ncbi:hypothetical protein [Adhaeribacter soli]|uniref:DUF4276 family protein n=1 Tax=Adhaeribacter soli TaxID=2607655 RepID=A0A5N1J2G4_9BACT|nr:hypothetical protein [Adhaeribacter soli]KAA9340237.1 hypothetical protein F0P94_07775 [Adhaeribacter soli]